MTLEVETIVAVSLMMAVFSAVAAVGTSIVLGAGFERLRAGFDVVRRQTGFFSDAINKLEKKVEQVDEQTGQFSHNITKLEAKVAGVGEQANAFSDSIKDLKGKVEIVDKQTGFFSEALHKLERKVEATDAHEKIIAEKLEESADSDTISTGKAEALVAHAEDLLSQMATIATRMHTQKNEQKLEGARLSIPRNLAHYVSTGWEGEEIRYN
jgi:chromosome segregation ATPase